MAEGKKEYYTISEVADRMAIAASVLRYWETQFRQLRPKKVRKRRYYTGRDIELVERIHELLYTDKMTIEGARLELEKQSEKIAKRNNILLEIKKDLNNILDDLE
jgi:DNA-binding transcriptional MerR regulator